MTGPVRSSVMLTAAERALVAHTLAAVVASYASRQAALNCRSDREVALEFRRFARMKAGEAREHLEEFVALRTVDLLR